MAPAGSAVCVAWRYRSGPQAVASRVRRFLGGPPRRGGGANEPDNQTRSEHLPGKPAAAKQPGWGAGIVRSTISWKCRSSGFATVEHHGGPIYPESCPLKQGVGWAPAEWHCECHPAERQRRCAEAVGRGLRGAPPEPDGVPAERSGANGVR